MSEHHDAVVHFPTMSRLALGLLVALAAAAAAACAGGDERSNDGVPASAALDEGATERTPGGDTETPPPQPAPQGPTRASVEREAPPAAAMPRRVEVMQLVLSPVETARAEDGRGGTVAAVDPLALDLRAAEGFGGRARDPVLHVGQLTFHHYSHPAPDTLRFVVADRSLLPDGAEVALQYGDDQASRVVVTDSLQVPR